MDADVLIVGAGPSGLMLANQLARRGSQVIIIDRHSGPAQQSRALGVQARTMEIYAKLGIVERALELGKRGTGAVIWAQGKRMARVPLGETGLDETPYPFIFVLGQDDNERIMGDKLRELGVTVQWNTELVSLVQEPNFVTATVRQSDGSQRRIVAGWVAGCDGAHSTVREVSGITFPGAPYEHVFFVADVEMTGTMVRDEVNVYLWRDGFHLLFPMRGEDHWRIVGILPEALRNRPELSFDAVIPSLRNEAGAELSFKTCTWFSTYRIHHRSAARFRDRRCFLIGDAAHIHSPVGAQGMNTGLQDAYNLAWKLDLVIKGLADESLLATYEEERIPVAKRLLNTTDRAFRLVVSNTWLAGLFRTKILARIAAFAMGRKRIQRFAFGVVSQLGIHYRSSSLSKTLEGLPDGAPRGGERFPWLRVKFRGRDVVDDAFQKVADTQFSLIVIGQALPPAGLLGYDDLMQIHAIAVDPINQAELARRRIPECAFYLLRPDGHIGLCGTRLDVDAVRQYMAEQVKIEA